jgi:hypothetical protein
MRTRQDLSTWKNGQTKCWILQKGGIEKFRESGLSSIVLKQLGEEILLGSRRCINFVGAGNKLIDHYWKL